MNITIPAINDADDALIGHAILALTRLNQRGLISEATFEALIEEMARAIANEIVDHALGERPAS